MKRVVVTALVVLVLGAIVPAVSAESFVIVFSKTADPLTDVEFWLPAGDVDTLVCDMECAEHTLRVDGIERDILAPHACDNPVECYLQFVTSEPAASYVSIYVTIVGRKGDFDGDGDVDHLDLFEFVFVWGLTCDDPGYNAIGDFDDDCLIHYLDLFDFVFAYDDSDPQYGASWMLDEIRKELERYDRKPRKPRKPRKEK